MKFLSADLMLTAQVNEVVDVRHGALSLSGIVPNQRTADAVEPNIAGQITLERAMNVQRDARGFNELRKMHSPFFDSRPLRDQALTQLHDRL